MLRASNHVAAQSIQNRSESSVSRCISIISLAKIPKNAVYKTGATRSRGAEQRQKNGIVGLTCGYGAGGGGVGRPRVQMRAPTKRAEDAGGAAAAVGSFGDQLGGRNGRGSCWSVR
jgi:hypothetical protein